MPKPRLLLADDHPILRLGIEALLADRFEIAGVAPDGQTLVEMADRLHPDLVILDISMPVLSGLEAASQIRQISPKTKLIFLSMHSNLLYVKRALEVGASAYLLKSSATEELVAAIDKALNGGIYLSAAFDRGILENFRTASGRPPRANLSLTKRQTQILQYLADGLQNKEIAFRLNIGAKTVEFHRARLMNKLGIHSVGQLTRFAIEQGLVAADLPVVPC